jgi:hypothetical protein
MYTVTYYKMGTQWFLDLPDYLDKGGDSENLERIGSFCDFLEYAAEGQNTVVFHMDVNPFDGADVLELTGSTGDNSGGYYHISSLNGRMVDFELWFNTIIYEGQKTLPEKIYIRKVPLSE